MNITPFNIFSGIYFEKMIFKICKLSTLDGKISHLQRKACIFLNTEVMQKISENLFALQDINQPFQGSMGSLVVPV